MKSEAINDLQHVLIKCITACETCATECLSEKDAHRMEKCIRLNRDCADICALATRLLARKSDYTKSILKKCIKICRACEDECRKHSHWHCKKCADICHECHKACEKYVQDHFKEEKAKKEKGGPAGNGSKEELDLMV